MTKVSGPVKSLQGEDEVRRCWWGECGYGIREGVSEDVKGMREGVLSGSCKLSQEEGRASVKAW